MTDTFQPKIGPILEGTTDLYKRFEAMLPFAMQVDPVATRQTLADPSNRNFERWVNAHQPEATPNQHGRWISNARGTGWEQTQEGQDKINDMLLYFEDKINHFCPPNIYFGGADGLEPRFGFWEMPDDEVNAVPDSIREAARPLIDNSATIVLPFKWEDLGSALAFHVITICQALEGLGESLERGEGRRPAGHPKNEAHERIVNALRVLQDGAKLHPDEDVFTETLPARDHQPIVAGDGLVGTMDTIRQARTWLVDCFPDQEEEIRDAHEEHIIRQTYRHFDGGWHGFLLTCDPPPLDRGPMEQRRGCGECGGSRKFGPAGHEDTCSVRGGVPARK